MVYFIIMNKFLEHKYTLWAILLAALILRLIPTLGAISDETRLLRPDSIGYLAPARSIAESATFPTTRRPPGYPLLASAVYFSGLGNKTLAVIQVIISVATCAVTAWAATAYSGKKSIGNIAAALMAGNLTAIANAPILLSDTLFALFAAGEFLFFIRYYQQKKCSDLFLCTFIAALAVLIRPINQLFILVLLTLILTISGVPWKQRLIHSVTALLIFAAVITPWMLRNYRIGATFDIDTNTGAMRHQNGAMLMAEVNGTDFESEKQRLLAIEREAFADTTRFPDERSRENWRKAEFRQMVYDHPFIYFSQHFTLLILLPDAPSFCESMGATVSDRGTMGVLKKDGIFAAVKHYFGENYIWFLLCLIPLLVPVGILYLASFCRLGHDLINWKKSYPELLIFLAFAEYYLFLPGAITAPRYQLPALPVLCTLAACALWKLMQKKNVEIAEDPDRMEV
ncbi:MAG: hypothetical protein E7053_04685 [Lentisphaerae bacterium]|nr:hypothetical protein [Lentisphaerota bacterium]